LCLRSFQASLRGAHHCQIVMTQVASGPQAHSRIVKTQIKLPGGTHMNSAQHHYWRWTHYFLISACDIGCARPTSLCMSWPQVCQAHPLQIMHQFAKIFKFDKPYKDVHFFFARDVGINLYLDTQVGTPCSAMAYRLC